MKWTQKKTVRYGSLSAGLIVAVIAVVIVLNVIVSALFSAFGTHLDMTGDNLFEVSEESHALLNKVTPSENNVTIYFLTDPDNLGQIATAANGYTSTGLWGMKYIHELALELAEQYSYISVEYLNPTKDPSRIKAILGEDYENFSLSSSNIIIDNYAPMRDSKGEILIGENGEPTEYWHNYRVYSKEAFYGFNTSTYGVIAFKGDYRFTSAILSLTAAKAPVAYFISGHGEPVGSYQVGNEEKGEFGDAASLWNLLRDCGYEIRHIDLKYEDFDADENALAVIFSPKSDYIAGTADQKGEIDKLKSFVSGEKHSIMVFMDPDTRELSNLSGFMDEVGGVAFEEGRLKNNGSASVTVDGYSIVGDLTSSGNPLSEKLSSVASDSKTIFRLSRAIRITDGSKAGAVYALPEGTVLEKSDGREDALKGDAQSALMTVSQVGDTSYLIACGTSMLPYTSYTENPGYANRELICASLSLTSQTDTAYTVHSRVIPNEGLDLTTHEATVWTVVLSTGLPLIIAVLGICMYVRRRHS